MRRKGDWLEMNIPDIWDGKSLEKIFRDEWEAPKKLTHLFRMEHKVLVNSVRANWTQPLEVGAKLQLKLFEEEELQYTPWHHDLSILYEDDHCLVVNKPPFMNTHPNDTLHDTDTLLNAITFYMQSKGEIRNIRQIHRLDRDTSGAILFGKHALAGAILDRMLEKREIKRTYIAMVHEIVKNKRRKITEPIGRDRHHPTRRRVSPSGQQATTNYSVIKVDENKKLSYVKCWLDTGRTHQIRVHLSHIGHPLVGDVLYGGQPLVKRQALHAAKLEFIHPFTKENVVCLAPFTDQPPIFKDININAI